MQLPAHTDIPGFDSLRRGESGGLPSASPRGEPASGVAAFIVINDELGQVKELINEQLLCCPDKIGVRRLVEHLNGCGGKMIRPGLVLLAGGAVGKITDKHIHIAAIMEMIHNATLLHDDVIDEGQKRRGRATVNSLWGNESAVLLGDFLLSKVFKMCADLETEVVKIIATAAGRTCEGELRQIAQRENWQLSETEYIDIITEKSAAFLSSCCCLGGFLSGAGENEVRLLSDFGLNLGIAFQITDDLLDIVGDEAKTGKTLGGDVDKNKLTLSVIHLLANAEENQKGELIKKLVAARDSKRTFVEILKSNGSLEYAYCMAKEYVSKAAVGLSKFEDSAAKESLIKTANYVTERVTL
jgi:octaprenyl-diphosphate synthase